MSRDPYSPTWPWEPHEMAAIKEALVSDNAEKVPQFPVPEGWFTFGTHVDRPGPLEFSTETGEDGLPLWERPLPPAEGKS